MKKSILITFLLLSYNVVSAQGWWNSKKVKGNGNITTETRTIDSFEQVSLKGSFDIILIDGKEGTLTIEGEENIIPYITTEVNNGRLKIDVKKNTNLRITRKLVITIPFEQIESASIGGSGSITSKKTIIGDELSFSIGGSGNIKAPVDAKHVKTSIGGSGNIELSGTTNTMKCQVSGSGNVRAYELSVDDLKANIAGSGDIRASVNQKIKANVAGSGSVYYKGNPKYVDTNSVGSGSVIKRD